MTRQGPEDFVCWAEDQTCSRDHRSTPPGAVELGAETWGLRTPPGEGVDPQVGSNYPPG